MKTVAQTVIEADRFYTIAAKGGSVIQAVEKATNGGDIRLGKYEHKPEQEWAFVREGDGVYRIRNRASGKLIDLMMTGTANGTWLHLWEDVGGTSQMWAVEPTPAGTVRLRSSWASGKCIDTVGMGANDGAILQIWQEAAGDDQLWTISEVKDRAKRAPAKKAEEPAVDAAPAVESAPAEEAKPEVKAEPVVEEKPVEEPAKAEEKPAEPVKAKEMKAEPVKAAAPVAKAPAKKPAAKKTSRAARKKALADNTGGCNGNVGFRNAEQLSSCLCHAAGILHAVRCAGVRVACISNDSACYAILEVLHGNVQRSRLNAIHRVSGSRGAFAFAENDRGIIISSAFLDAAAHAARLEALCGTNAAFDNLHNCFLLLKSEV